MAGERRRGLPNLHARGERHPLSKLTREQVLAIKRRIAAYEEARAHGHRTGAGLSAIAREFGISDSLVRNIRSGRSWGWLQMPHL